jgi:uncharacterized protein YkwD
VRKHLAVLAVAVVLVTAQGDSSYEACFRSMTNAERTSRGIAALKVYQSEEGRPIDRVARDWADKMAQAGDISHNPNLERELPPFEYGGEDVGMGPTCEEIHQAFMNSKSHKAVMLDRDYLYLGVGVTVTDGTVFVTLDMFTPRRKPAPKASPTPIRSACP